MSNPRPRWCPHADCEYLLSFQESCCGGRLPKLEPHDEDFNTHRLCIEADGVFDLQVNRNDLFVLLRLIGVIYADA